MTIIDSFAKQYSFLSNFHVVPHGVYRYSTNEHFFQAMKFESQAHRENIKAQSTPGRAKRYAWNNRADVRENWKDISIDVMLTGLRAKFKPGTELAEKLIATAPAYLIEGNYWHDNFWGNCTCNNKDGNHPECIEQGTNALGQILMWVREELIDPNAHDVCFKCTGGNPEVGIPKGHIALHGHIDGWSGQWKGSTGVCYQCRGTGVETIQDRIRTNHYYDKYFKVGGEA